MPPSFSYTKGDARIDAKLVDSGFNQLLIAPLSMYLAAGYEKETDEGYEKSAKILPDTKVPHQLAEKSNLSKLPAK